MTVAVGQPAPDFTLPAEGGGSVSLKDLKGRKVVLYFYPKDDTTGCTAQACAFRDAMPDFTATGAEIIGVSKDNIASHERFKAKHGLPFRLVSDLAGAVCEAYGVWTEKSMYGRKYFGIERSTFLIDEQGVVQAEWRKVKVTGHAAEVLKAARGSR